jgi:hypothetical protein
MSALAPLAAVPCVKRHVERRLAEFVDRDAEMTQFCRLLGDDAEDKPIMVVHGETGMGKTSLLLRMIHECALRGLRKSEVGWSDTHPHDYMAVMRKIRDDVGVEHFQRFTDLINYYTDATYQPKLELTLVMQGSAGMEVASGMQVRDSTVGTVAGVVIKDSMFVVPRPDVAVPEPIRRAQLTECFLDGLQAAARSSLLVIFLDAVEKASADTLAWLWEQWLDSVRAESLRNVRFVLLGQRPPPSDRDWDDYVERAELKPLALDHIIAYLGKRAARLSEETRRELAKMIHVYTKGRPTDVAAAVDAYLRSAPG